MIIFKMLCDDRRLGQSRPTGSGIKYSITFWKRKEGTNQSEAQIKNQISICLSLVLLGVTVSLRHIGLTRATHKKRFV